MRNIILLKQTLPQPNKPGFIPDHAQWLAGEGAGSWFALEKTSQKNTFEITRFSPKGKIECQGLFTVENSQQTFNIYQDYKFVHLSHCQVVNIKQTGSIIKLIRN